MSNDTDADNNNNSSLWHTKLSEPKGGSVRVQIGKLDQNGIFQDIQHYGKFRMTFAQFWEDYFNTAVDKRPIIMI